jgi:hypothetical protein
MGFCDIQRDAVRGEGGFDLPEPCLRRVGVVNAERYKAVEIKNVQRFGHGLSEVLGPCSTVAVYFKQLITLTHTHTHVNTRGRYDNCTVSIESERLCQIKTLSDKARSIRKTGSLQIAIRTNAEFFFYRKPQLAAKICFTASGSLQDFPATSGHKSWQLEKNLAHY